MSEFFAITFLIMLAAISPGPDFAMVTKNSLLYSRKAGILTAMGISCSLLIHASYCILGLAIIISKSLLIFSIIKYIGAAYLSYIGIKALLAKREIADYQDNNSNKKDLHAYQAFRQGLLCNLLNPKAIMFLLAFFTIIIKPTISWSTQIGYGLEIGIVHMLWFSSLALMITHRRVRSILNKVQFYIVKVMGVVLIGFGIKIATLHQS